MSEYVFETNALEEFAEWAIYDKKVFKKIMTLLRDIKRSPYDGIGKPDYDLKNQVIGLAVSLKNTD